ncbi:MAG: hotdog domain-containing protein [bacterium]|jgi:acyl-CoA thioesterase YciA|nr:hotdog domain-containing protein [bacterium]
MQRGPQPAIRVMMMPKDTNGFGTIFGGVILSLIDVAGAAEARFHTRHRVVTVAMREVVFHQPVYVGDTVSCYTELVKKGRTSLTVKVMVEAQRASDPSKTVQVTEAETVFVAVAGDGTPVLVDA